MPQFFTRSSFGQPQPQAAQLPFSQFGGQRPILPTDTTGGLPFPDAGQPQPAPFSPLRPTGLSEDELNALLGRDRESRFRTTDDFGQLSLPSFPQQQQTTQPTSSLPAGGIAFEGSGTQDKFNPVLAGGVPLNNLNLAGSTQGLPNPNKVEFGGGF